MQGKYTINDEALMRHIENVRKDYNEDDGIFVRMAIRDISRIFPTMPIEAAITLLSEITIYKIENGELTIFGD